MRTVTRTPSAHRLRGGATSVSCTRARCVHTLGVHQLRALAARCAAPCTHAPAPAPKAASEALLRVSGAIIMPIAARPSCPRLCAAPHSCASWAPHVSYSLAASALECPPARRGARRPPKTLPRAEDARAASIERKGARSTSSVLMDVAGVSVHVIVTPSHRPCASS